MADRRLRALSPSLPPTVDGRLLRFAAVGLSNAAASFAAFWSALTLLTGVPGAATAAQTIGYAVGILWSYSWNRIWTFGDRAAVRRTLPSFVAVQLALLLLSAGLIGLAVDLLGSPAPPAWLAVMALVTLLNYTALRRWVFRRTSSFPPSHRGRPAPSTGRSLFFS